MNLLFRKAVAPYFFLGFLLAAFLKLPVIAIGGLGVIIAVLVTRRGDEGVVEEEVVVAAEGGVALVTKGDLRRIFFRSMLLEANFNFETMQSTGVAYALAPVLKKIYAAKGLGAGAGKEDISAALERHVQLFNTATYGSTLILGLATAMEEQNSKDPEFNAESINAVKLGLMGPLAGVFDSLFWGTLKVIAAGAGTALALKGNVSGVVVFILLFNVPHLLLRYQLTFIGYRTGMRFLQRLSQSNVMDRLSQGAAILGLMVVGAMPATLMNVHTPVLFGGGVGLQGILDQIIPAVLPLGLTFLVYYFVKKGVKTTYLLLGLLALGLVGSLLHLLS
ncbi:MAG: PTS system mannose/fructose/sorbose family transporter subunit IID [Bacteroidetes bacterium]|nr:PTS system mannose/fructose/sorbose family transporter subunit IID [Bacteroidota bacterium]